MVFACQLGSEEAQVEALPKPGTPGLMVLMATGALEPGTKARFTALLVWGPLMPGPLRKKPNTSLYWEHTNSGYSSEPNTNRKLSESPVGMKSNSSTATQRWELTK